MITFILSFVALIIGYMVYGKFVEKVFGINENKETPAYSKADGVDYVPMGSGRGSLVQLLNIAGLGPIFGPIAGALWGPAAFLWIVLGGIFAGAVHDYFSGMLSVRNGGAQLPDIVGKYLGQGMRQFVNVFSVVLLILVGTVFVAGPANLIVTLTPSWISLGVVTAVIFIYYILATLLPIDKIIGKIYPIFGLLLIIMAVGVGAGLIIKGYHIPELTLSNLHPKNLPMWPLLFITIACGAISGFHATQSPLIARTIENEKYGRKVFYGMMIGESAIALVWAAAGMAVFGGTGGLQEALAAGGPAGVVRTVSITMLGAFGGTLAIIGVIILPITSGDTAFRGARMVIADFMKMSQKPMSKRLAISIPIFAVAYGLSRIDFNFLWRYFSWANQTTAMILLWAAAVYLVKEKRLHWIATLPAIFMTAVTFTYLLQAPEGFSLPTSISYPVGLLITLGITILFANKVLKERKLKTDETVSVSAK
ncbi:carbon starvation protein, predicted membrane protein [Desulfosporosinus orientis DSM 765]|uniref:Carbon starvation protein, predicted membrane protein n=1 Tax=Desulfosporosinus orientis (strain ATCC 19365 / DSM 765 / NCIMB 8382 / VKM B-1628 / Singapore I) TaxID=768706 RepID=G7W7V6_DESOD|nr:carbon starvation protein A [Desulfosporosinus orientis]AET66171.1 carbon starvation protein, predicted membrane protein [Desulfosporosinus orientis DSM 765]